MLGKLDHPAHVMIHDFGELLHRGERDVLSAMLDVADMLVAHAGGLGHLHQCQATLESRDLQVLAEDGL